jgi:hypothetical protein
MQCLLSSLFDFRPKHFIFPEQLGEFESYMKPQLGPTTFVVEPGTSRGLRARVEEFPARAHETTGRHIYVVICNIELLRCVLRVRSLPLGSLCCRPRCRRGLRARTHWITVKWIGHRTRADVAGSLIDHFLSPEFHGSTKKKQTLNELGFYGRRDVIPESHPAAIIFSKQMLCNGDRTTNPRAMFMQLEK